MLRLTIYFFGGFATSMMAFGCVASLIIATTGTARLLWSLGLAAASLATVHAVRSVFQILSGEPFESPLHDARLKD